jgi:hypothetical protein
MNSGVRIVKRGKVESAGQPEVQEKQESNAPNERKITSTIKAWIADREERRRLNDQTNWNLLVKFGQ